jgi:hypothetical protein
MPALYAVAFKISVFLTAVFGGALLIDKARDHMEKDPATNAPKVELKAEAEPTPRHEHSSPRWKAKCERTFPFPSGCTLVEVEASERRASEPVSSAPPALPAESVPPALPTRHGEGSEDDVGSRDRAELPTRHADDVGSRDRAELQRRVQAARARLDQLYVDHVEGRLSLTSYERLRERFQAEEGRAVAALDAFEAGESAGSTSPAEAASGGISGRLGGL